MLFKLGEFVRSTETTELAAGRPVPTRGKCRGRKDQDSLASGTYTFMGTAALAASRKRGFPCLGTRLWARGQGGGYREQQHDSRSPRDRWSGRGNAAGEIGIGIRRGGVSPLRSR